MENVVHAAIRGGSYQITLELILAGANIHGTKDNSPLLQAVHYSLHQENDSFIYLLLSLGVHGSRPSSLLNYRNLPQRDFPLWNACRSCNTRTIFALLNSGVPVEDYFGSPPLLHSVPTFVEWEEIVLELIKRGADTTQINNFPEGSTILHEAILSHGSLDGFKTLLGLTNPTPNVNQQNFEGKTPLHFLCANKWILQSVGKCRALLDAGADVMVYDNDEKIPMQYLDKDTGKGEEIRQMLIDAGSTLEPSLTIKPAKKS